MFDSVVLRRAEQGLPVSLGQIAEALLFYRKTHLILDENTLKGLTAQLGLDGTLALLRRPELSSTYCEQLLGTKTDTVNGFEIHDFVAVTWASTGAPGADDKSPAARLASKMTRDGTDARSARRFAESLMGISPPRRFDGNHFVAGGVPTVALKNLFNGTRLAAAATEAVRHEADDPALPPVRFDMHATPSGFVIFHDIDFPAINARSALLKPGSDPLTVAQLLTTLLSADCDLLLAAHYGGDFFTSNVSSSIIRLQHAELLRRGDLNLEAREGFVETVLPDVPDLRSVVDAGERSFDEFLHLLDKADRFKRWVGKVNPEVGLVQAYFQEASATDWLQTTPSKAVRLARSSELLIQLLVWLLGSWTRSWWRSC